MKTSNGFTLIELMIVIAIVGILAAIAMPAYQNYIARSQVTESIRLLLGARSVVETQVSETGQFPASLADLTLLGVTTSGKYVTTTSVQDNGSGSGAIIATFKSTGTSSRISGKTMVFSRSNSAKWVCESGGGNPVSDTYLPQGCR